MNKYWLIIRNTWDEYLVYRLNFILWRVRMVIRLIVIYFLWAAIFSNTGNLFGYNQSTILTYTILTYLISNFVIATRTQEIGAMINDGRLSNYLLKPLDFFKSLAAIDISDKLLNFGFTLLELSLFLMIVQPPFVFQSNLAFIVLSFLAFIGAIFIYFFISALLGFIGFWTNEVWAARFIFIIVLDYLSGNFFPIDILPKIVTHILLLTPFPYIIYFPVKIYLGQLGIFELTQGFMVLSFWLVFLYLVMMSVWQRGLRVFSAEGR